MCSTNKGNFMTQKNYRLHSGEKGSAIAVRVIPRARKNEIVELLSDGTVRIRLTAPPAEGKANDVLTVFLADVLGIPKSKIEIVAGLRGRDKLVSVIDMDADSVHQKILEHIA
jgi:uncharacterized protein (TIGR00251 family)